MAGTKSFVMRNIYHQYDDSEIVSKPTGQLKDQERHAQMTMGSRDVV